MHARTVIQIRLMKLHKIKLLVFQTKSCTRSWKAKQRFCDSIKPLSKPLSTNVQNWEPSQDWSAYQECIDDPSRRSPKNPEHHLMYWRTGLSQFVTPLIESMRTLQSKTPCLKRQQRLISHLPRSILVISKIFWKIWTEETKVEICASCALCFNRCKSNRAFDKEHHTNSKTWFSSVMLTQETPPLS